MLASITKTIAETDSDGTTHYITKLADAYKVSGDSFYMQEGKAVLPLGTLTVEETKAPNGYLLEGAYMQAGDKSEQIKGLDPKSERGNWKETLPEIAHEINIVNLTSDKDNAGLLDPFVIMDLAFGILEENENNPARVLDIQKYVNRQYDSCSRKKFMKVLETLVHAMGNDEGFIGDMYACNKKARNYYLDEMIQSFNFVFDEMCHGTGSAANCDFDVKE